MSIYYFDIFVQGRLIEDETGIELPSIDTAISECASALPDVSDDVLAKGRNGSVVMLVRDEIGRLIHKATLTVSFEHLPGSTKYLAAVKFPSDAEGWTQ